MLENQKIIFVSDFFSDEILGGAELSSEALLSYYKHPVLKLKSKNITPELINLYSNYFWIFGNFSHLNHKLFELIIKKINYSIIEYDYKHCKYRSFEKHSSEEGRCNCNESEHGKLINLFFMSAKSIFWMSQLQKDLTTARFQNLLKKDNFILSSIFSNDQLHKILSLQNLKQKDSWTYLKSNSWVKGTPQTESFLKDKLKQSRPIQNLSYNETLNLLSETENLVYLPAGSDTCPRLVIEAKLLDCNLHLNHNVQHQYEDWFKHSKQDLINYLQNNNKIFWNNIEKYVPKNVKNPLNEKISVIIPVRNSEKTLEKSLNSVINQTYKNLEIIIVINGSSDSSYDISKKYEKKDHRIKVISSEPGIVSALNTGLRASTGNIIARQDSDDVWYQNKIELQYEYMVHNGFDILGTQLDFNSSGNIFETNYPLEHQNCVNWLLNSQNPIAHPSVMFNKKILNKLGGYWEMFPYAEDMDLWFRAIPHYKIGNTPFKGMLYNFVKKNEHNDNISHIIAHYYKNLYGIK